MPAPENNPAEALEASHRLTPLYIVALTTVAVLSLGAELLIQRQLDAGENDSRVINVAGRQRMLSQRLAKNALLLSNADGGQQAEVRRQLAETRDEWVANQQALQFGGVEVHLPGGNSDRILELFNQIEDDFQAMKAAASELVEESATPSAQAIAIIQEREGNFLAGMDRIVSQYVVEAERRVERLRTLHRWILGLTLAVLLAEGLFVFRPAVRRIAQTTKRLRRARDEAEEANAAKTRFLANVSHELRTPMTAVLGMTELAREVSSDKKQQRYLRVVEEAGETLLGLLDDLIEMARIESGRIDLSNEPFDPRDSIEQVVRMMQPSAEERGVEVRMHLTEVPIVVGDARRLGQVLLNLASNAVKWTDHGSISIGCEVIDQSQEEATLRFYVRDTGVGISATDLQTLFEPFAQVGELEHGRRGGTGLGLAICRRILEAMGGRIELTSQPGEGTEATVEIRLPISELPI